MAFDAAAYDAATRTLAQQLQEHAPGFVWRVDGAEAHKSAYKDAPDLLGRLVTVTLIKPVDGRFLVVSMVLPLYLLDDAAYVADKLTRQARAPTAEGAPGPSEFKEPAL